MFRLTKDECLRSQIATLNMERGKHLKYMPYAFTESGVAMLSGVLRSTVAIDVNVRIMRAFVSMRRALSSIAPVLARVAETERLQLEEKAARLADQAKNDFRGDSPRRSYLGWWWMGKQMGAAIRPHSVLDAIPHDGFLTPFFFRIIGEGRRLPIPGIAEEDILMAGEGGDACCCYVAQKRLSNGNSTFYVWGLDILSDQPEAVALLNTLVDAD